MSEMNFEHQTAQLSIQDLEELKMLQFHPGWHIYKKTLMNRVKAASVTCISSFDPNQILKLTGEIAGLNLALNQLGLLVSQYEKQQVKRVDAESKKHPGTNVLYEEKI